MNNYRLVLLPILVILIVGIVTGASFISNETGGVEGSGFQFTDTTNGSQTGWAWFFGDEMYDQSWVEQTGNAEWNPRDEFKLAALPNNDIVLVGGYTSAPIVYTNDTWISSDMGITWTNITGTPPFPATEYMRIITLPDNSIIKLCGMYHKGEFNLTANYYYHDIWRSTDYGTTWTLQNASVPWLDRWITGVKPLSDGSIVVYSGSSRKDVWRSTDQGITWVQQTADIGWTTRTDFASVITPNDTIIITGGLSNVFWNDTWASTDKGLTWTKVNNSSGWQSRSMHDMVCLSDFTILLLGGQVSDSYGVTVGDQYRSNDIWKSTDNGTTWSQVTADAEWSPRFFSDRTIRFANDTIITIGDSGSVNDIWVSTDKGATWTKQNIISSYQHRFSPQITLTNDDKIVILGGTAGGSKYLDDVWKSSNLGVTWVNQQVLGDFGTRENFGFVTLPDGDLVIVAGDGQETSSGLYGDTWKSSDGGATWVQMNNSYEESCDGGKWCVRSFGATVSLTDGSIVTMGGWVGVDWDWSNDVWRSTDKGATWIQQNASAGWIARDSLSAVALQDNSIILTGGADAEYTTYNDVWISSDEGITWTQQTASAGWVARGSHTTVVLPDGSIILYGGYNVDGDSLNDVWRSTDRGVTWIELNEVLNPARGYVGSVGLSDGSIIIAGGSGSGFYNDVWRFNPVGSTEQNPVHTYTDEGLYRVSLQVRNALTTSSVTRSDYINITNTASESNFTSVNNVGFRPLTAGFTDASRFSPTDWDWYVGGNKVSDDQNPLITFEANGVYDINLYTSNAYGGSWANRTGYVVVGTAPAESSLQVNEDSQFYDSMGSIFATFNLGIILLGLFIVVMALCIVMSILSRYGMISDTMNIGGISMGVTEFTGVLMAVMVIGSVGIMIIAT